MSQEEQAGSTRCKTCSTPVDAKDQSSLRPSVAVSRESKLQERFSLAASDSRFKMGLGHKGDHPKSLSRQDQLDARPATFDLYGHL